MVESNHIGGFVAVYLSKLAATVVGPKSLACLLVKEC